MGLELMVVEGDKAKSHYRYRAVNIAALGVAVLVSVTIGVGVLDGCIANDKNITVGVELLTATLLTDGATNVGGEDDRLTVRGKFGHEEVRVADCASENGAIDASGCRKVS